MSNGIGVFMESLLSYPVLISLLSTLFLVIMAIAFGNSHPPASPVPIS